MRAKLYVYPYRIAERKPHPILWSFDTEALKEIAKNFKNKSVFNVEVKKRAIILRLIEDTRAPKSTKTRLHLAIRTQNKSL